MVLNRFRVTAISVVWSMFVVMTASRAAAQGMSLATLPELRSHAATDTRGNATVSRKNGIAFRSLDRGSLKCDIYMPEGDGPFPAVLVIHGGAWAWGSKSVYVRLSKRIATRGFVVMAINYRLAPKHPFPAQILDAQYAVRWLRHHAQEYRVDPQRIAALGYSAGGHLACLLGTADDQAFVDPDLPEELSRYSPRVPVVIAGGAVCDLDWVDENSTKLAYWLGGTPSSQPEAYRLASPRLHVSPDDARFFLYHGTRDQIVPMECAERMHETLRRAGCSSELHLLKNRDHFWAFFETAIVDDAVEYLKREWQINELRK